MNMFLRVRQDAAVLRLTLEDTKSRNSLSDGMLTALSEVLASAEHDDKVSVIIIAAEGSAFCSGHNLKELTARRSDADAGAAYFADIFARCSKLMMQIRQHRCAVIAEVAGLASAAGCQLVASCDLAYASTKASFCTPGVNIGLFCSTPMVALSRNVTPKHALEMLLSGDVYNAEYAFRVGLVNALVEHEDLTTYVATIATKLGSKSSTAIGYGKKLFHAQQELSLSDSYRMSSEVMVRNMLDTESCEGIGAFLDKRQPKWREGTS